MANSTIIEDIRSAKVSPSDPVTDNIRQAFQLLNYVILCGVVSFFGIGANIINIAVFVRQGFQDSINISLLGLAVSDLVCSLSMFWISVFYNPLVLRTGLPIDSMDFTCMTGALPHVCFNRITSIITAFITVERCLCIAMPLKVKNIITPFRTKVINVSIFVSTVFLFSPIPSANNLGWKFSTAQNRSILGILDKPQRELVNSVSFLFNSVLLSSAVLIIVVISTVILVIKLSEKTKWRKSVTAQTTSNQESTSVKDKKVVKMITLISVIFIICYVPPTFSFLVIVVYPDFSIIGRLRNTYLLTWSVSFVLEAINSSVNIFVYYKMSTKFKDTFCATFCGYKKKA